MIKRCFSPWLNATLRYWQTSNLPGKYRLYHYFKSHQPYKLIRYNIQQRDFFVPIDEWCFWLEKGPENYYLNEFIPFCNELNKLNQSFTFFDLGADIGTVSSLVAAHCPRLEKVIAFEPNSSSFSILETNIKAINSHNIAINKAVSNHSGKATMIVDQSKTIDHEGCIDINTAGNIDVVSIDGWLEDQNDLNITNAAIKIDVEGQERETLEGATKLIKSTNNVIVLLELHPEVLNRTRETPEVLFSEAEKIRTFSWFVPALGNQKLDRSKPFFSQYPTQQYDIIGIAS